jgi:hypothetical protein
VLAGAGTAQPQMFLGGDIEGDIIGSFAIKVLLSTGSTSV